MFVILEEGCTKNCHPKKWADEAAPVFQQFNRQLGPLVGPPKAYTGIGNRTSRGRRCIPFGLKTEGGKFVEGDLKSNELADGDNALLLSLAAQATLGLVKDVETGRCFMKKHNDYVTMYAVKGSGLRCICISKFDMPQNVVPTSIGVIDASPTPERLQAHPASSVKEEEAEPLSDRDKQAYKQGVGIVMGDIAMHGSASLEQLSKRVVWGKGNLQNLDSLRDFVLPLVTVVVFGTKIKTWDFNSGFPRNFRRTRRVLE